MSLTGLNATFGIFETMVYTSQQIQLLRTNLHLTNLQKLDTRRTYGVYYSHFCTSIRTDLQRFVNFEEKS